MSKYLYLFESPFLVEDLPSNRTRYLSETIRLTEYEREDEQRLRALVLDYALKYKLIEPKADGSGFSVVYTDILSSWRWQLLWTNMRSLVDRSQYSKVCMGLQIDEGLPLDLLLNLHFQIGTSFDAILLNTVVNRVMHAIQLVPYDTTNADAVIEWNTIHRETPWIWLVLFLQTVIQQETMHGF